MIAIHFAQFSAPYKGAFIKSLERLEELNKSEFRFIYVFPEKTKQTPWINSFVRNHEVYFTKDKLINCSAEIVDLFNEIEPDIVHTHFDGYDMPVCWARKKYLKSHKKEIKIVWHLHNTVVYNSNILKQVYQYFIFKYHYGYLASKVNIIAVSQEMKDFIYKFKKRRQEKLITTVLSNGVAIPTISGYQISKQEGAIFGAFGGRNSQKRIDLLLEAGIILAEQNKNFKVHITKGLDTQKVVNQVFQDKHPPWLLLINQTEIISEFFMGINCFVSTSVHETFSFAILEATFYNIPVIQSDILGTRWNSSNPSTFVFESLNSKDLSSKMQQFLASSNVVMKQKCLDTKANNASVYDIDIWCKKVIDIYDRLVN